MFETTPIQPVTNAYPSCRQTAERVLTTSYQEQSGLIDTLVSAHDQMFRDSPEKADYRKLAMRSRLGGLGVELFSNIKKDETDPIASIALSSLRNDNLTEFPNSLPVWFQSGHGSDGWVEYHTNEKGVAKNPTNWLSHDEMITDRGLGQYGVNESVFPEYFLTEQPINSYYVAENLAKYLYKFNPQFSTEHSYRQINHSTSSIYDLEYYNYLSSTQLKYSDRRENVFDTDHTRHYEIVMASYFPIDEALYVTKQLRYAINFDHRELPSSGVQVKLSSDRLTKNQLTSMLRREDGGDAVETLSYGIDRLQQSVEND